MVKFVESESTLVSDKGLGWGWGEGMGTYCLMGTEFHFSKVKRFRRWVMVRVSQQSEGT